MSRIGKKAVTVPAGVEVKIDATNLVTVKGPKGTVTKSFSGSKPLLPACFPYGLFCAPRWD